MAVTLFTGFLTLLLACLQLGYGAARIDIQPDTFHKLSEDAIHISCLPDKDGFNDAKDIFLIELYKGGDKPIVFLRRGSGLTYRNASQTHFEATGHIDDDDLDSSYLNITISSPTPEDEGTYTCAIFSVDGTGLVGEKKAIKNLRYENLRLSTEDTVLLQKIANLEKELAKKDSIATNRITSLEKKTSNQSRQIDDLSDKVFYSSAFLATKKNGNIKPSSGSVIVLPDVIMRLGTGYNESTGVYTAPVPGLYVFHIIVTSYNGCHFHLDLMANNKVLTRLFSRDNYVWDQSSTSAVIDLQAGDMVFTKVRHASCTLSADQYTVFTEYLIKAFS